MPIVSEVEYRGWPSPTWSGGGILPILATTSLSRTRKRYLANFRNIATLQVVLRSFPPLLTRMCCSSSDVMEACASLTRAERACLRGLMVPTEQTAVKDCQHKWAEVFNFQVQHLANIYWACVSCMFDQCWILDAVSAVEWHSASSYVSWEVVMWWCCYKVKLSSW